MDVLYITSIYKPVNKKCQFSGNMLTDTQNTEVVIVDFNSVYIGYA